MAKSVVGLFESSSDAQAAYQDLSSAGFGGNTITMVDQPSNRLSTMLVNAGIPESDAAIYANGVQQGGSLIVLQALQDADAQRAADVLDRYNIVDISGRQGFSQATTTRDTSRSGMTSLYQGGDIAIPIVEEELRVGKREVEGGGVRVNTRIEEVPVNEQVTLREETVDVHRKPVDRPVSGADFDTLQQGSFEVRERDEQAIVNKQARVVEEVHIKKNVEERTETINDTVRRTDVDVQEVGGSRTTDAVNRNATGTTGTTGNEGFIEGTLGNVNNTIERNTGIDTDRSGNVGDRDTRNNF